MFNESPCRIVNFFVNICTRRIGSKGATEIRVVQNRSNTMAKVTVKISKLFVVLYH